MSDIYTNAPDKTSLKQREDVLAFLREKGIKIPEQKEESCPWIVGHEKRLGIELQTGRRLNG